MDDVTLSYKGSDILELSDSGSATLKTGGTYCEADIEVEYVKPSGGDSKDVNAFAEGTWWPTRVVIDEATTIKSRALNYMYGAEELFVGSQVTSVGSYPVNNNDNLKTIVWLTKINSAAPFIGNKALTICDVHSNNENAIGTLGWQNDTVLKTIILRQTSAINTLPNINCFTGTPFASGGTGGTLYVPQALISSYQSATNWSTILGYANNQILKIEGSYYATHYADGTEIPT